MKIAEITLLTSVMLFVSGCATWQPPGKMTEIEVFGYVSGLDKTHPQKKIYRQYVSDDRYLQFDRITDDNVIYGWHTCTNCNWTRVKMAAIYTGSYLYLIYGHHEDFFKSPPEDIPVLSDWHWSWNAIEKLQVEGRNLIKLAEIRKCPYDYPVIKEWTNGPWRADGEIDCSIRKSGRYESLWVATIDETLAGEKDSIVDLGSSKLRERLKALEDLYRDGVIDEFEYETKRREILDNL